MVVIVASFLILYMTAKINSHNLVKYVVEQTLVQKAPAGTGPDEIHAKLQALLDAIPDRRSRTDALFRISSELEKVQDLSPQALERLLAPKRFKVLK